MIIPAPFRRMIRLFRVFIPAGVFTLLISDFLLITSAFVLTSYLVLEADPTVYLLYDNGFVQAPADQRRC